MRRALGLLVVAALQLGAAPVRSHAPTGDVLGVSVLPGPGRAEVVVDLRGPVEVTDFVLANPARLVLDLAGARLVGPSLLYDGVNRAGIRNIRYSQFRPDVVRVVIELDQTRDYQMVQGPDAVRVTFAATQTFAAWPVGAGANAAAPTAAPAPADAPASVVVNPTPSRPADLPAAIPAPSPARRGEVLAARPAQGAPQASQQPRVSVNFQGASIHDVIANFASFSGRSIITGQGVGGSGAGTITAEIHDQPWDVAFQAILGSQGLTATELPSGIIRVDSRTLVSQDTSAPLETRQFKINYARAGALTESVRPILTKNRGLVQADTTTNSLIVTDLASRMAVIGEFINTSLDVRTPQVAIQAKIIYVDRTSLEELGFRYDLGTAENYFTSVFPRNDSGTGTPRGASTASNPFNVVLSGSAVAAVANASAVVAKPAIELMYATVLGNYALSAFLQATETYDLSDMQAEPQMTVLDNQRANLFVGQITPVRMVDPSSPASGPARATVVMQNSGIKLEVTPHVVRNTGEILMELKAENSDVQSAASADFPGTFTSQTGQTQLLVRDGETAVIGGLTVTTVTTSRVGIPFLVNLPVVGRLFGKTLHKQNRRDVLFLVTPHIVDDLSARDRPNP